MATEGGTVADAARRRRLAVLAGHNGDAAGARSYLTDDEPSVRSAALAALARCGDLSSAELSVPWATGLHSSGVEPPSWPLGATTSTSS